MVAVMGAIALAAGAAVSIGGITSASNKRKSRGDSAYSDMRNQYSQIQSEVAENAYDQSMNMAMTQARGGGTAGSQASGTQAAIAQAPQAANQAEMTGHEAAIGYAGMANKYRTQQLMEDKLDHENTWGAAKQGIGAMGGGMASAGAGMLSDERTKEFNKRVGKDIGHPGMYETMSDKSAKNYGTMSDARAKELEGKLAQAEKAAPAATAVARQAVQTSGGEGGQPIVSGVDQGDPQNAVYAGQTQLSGAGPRTATSGLGNDVNNPNALPNSDTLTPQMNRFNEHKARMNSEQKSADEWQQGVQHLVGENPGFKGGDYASQFQAPASYQDPGPQQIRPDGIGMAPGQVPAAIAGYDGYGGTGGYSPGQAAPQGPTAQPAPAGQDFGMHTLPEGHPGLEGNPNRPPPAPAEQLEQRVEQQQQATEEQDVLDDEFLAWAREQGVAVGSGPEEEGGDVAPTPPPVKQAFASSGAGGTVTPQAAVTTIDQVDIVGDPNEIDEVNVVGDSNAPEPQAGGSFSYGDTGSTLGFGGGGRDSAYAASQQLAKDTPKIYPDTALGKVMESGDKRRAREKLRRKRRGAWQAYANDPDRVSGIVDQSLMEEDWMESDERAKGGIKQGTASAMFEETPGYSYHYKEQFQDDPGAAPGEHFGIMAQDLEKTPEGASMVQEDERGLKHVDTERLTMANSAALNEILARLNKMEGRND